FRLQKVFSTREAAAQGRESPISIPPAPPVGAEGGPKLRISVGKTEAPIRQELARGPRGQGQAIAFTWEFKLSREDQAGRAGSAPPLLRIDPGRIWSLGRQCPWITLAWRARISYGSWPRSAASDANLS